MYRLPFFSSFTKGKGLIRSWLMATGLPGPTSNAGRFLEMVIGFGRAASTEYPVVQRRRWATCEKK